jgi:cytoskeleton protein RodZ
MVVAPVTLYWWLNEGEDELVSKVPSTVQVDPVPLAMPGPLAEPVEAPVPAAPPATESNVAPVAPVAPPVEVSTPTEGGAPAAPENLDFGGVLYLEFSGDAWVEIKDASGRMLHRQLNLAGGKVNVRGHPPFDLVIGNAAQTRLLYNGRPIDLKPFTGLSVARFTLEE